MLQWFESIGASLPDVHRDLASASPIATEFLIESASGGSCVIRVVTSAFGLGGDWEHEFFTEMAASWIPILDKLAALLGGAPR